RRAVRDVLLADGRIVNVVKQDGRLQALAEVPERKPARLYLADDPAISHLRPDPAADGPQVVAAWAALVADGSAACGPGLRGPKAVRPQPGSPSTANGRTRLPVVGDDNFAELLRASYRAGQLTEREWKARLTFHRDLQRAQRPRGRQE